jgi:N-hydroxyarylamine O-acetyltransferase
MAADIDIEAYFRRIGHDGERAPTLETLRAIVARHAEAIPFENLDPLLGRPVRLDAAALEAKLVREGRGGYCYEHNLLLRHVLVGLGFRVAGLEARVLWNAPEGAVRPRTHMLLRVELDGAPFLADVGFGGQTLTAPLRLEPDAEQATPHEPFRLVRADADGALVVQSLVRDSWASLYRFGPQEVALVDYEVANWYVSTHPTSLFVTDLLAARAAPRRRYALRNNVLATHSVGGTTERRVLATAGELRAALEGPFRLRLPDDPRLDAALAHLAATSA